MPFVIAPTPLTFFMLIAIYVEKSVYLFLVLLNSGITACWVRCRLINNRITIEILRHYIHK